MERRKINALSPPGFAETRGIGPVKEIVISFAIGKSIRKAEGMDGPSPEERAQLGAAGAAAGIGCSIVVSLIFFIVGGVLLDRFTDRSPLFTLIGVVLGLIAAGYELLELSRVGRPDRAPGPLTRQITRLPIGRPQSATEAGTDWQQVQNGEEE